MTTTEKTWLIVCVKDARGFTRGQPIMGREETQEDAQRIADAMSNVFPGSFVAISAIDFYKSIDDPSVLDAIAAEAAATAAAAAESATDTLSVTLWGEKYRITGFQGTRWNFSRTVRLCDKKPCFAMDEAHGGNIPFTYAIEGMRDVAAPVILRENQHSIFLYYFSDGEQDDKPTGDRSDKQLWLSGFVIYRDQCGDEIEVSGYFAISKA